MKTGAEVIRISGACSGEGNCIHFSAGENDEIVLCRTSKKRCQFFQPRDEYELVCVCGHGVNFHQTTIAISAGSTIQIISQESTSKDKLETPSDVVVKTAVRSSVEIVEILQKKFSEWTTPTNESPFEIIIASPKFDDSFIELLSKTFDSSKIELSMYFRKSALPEISKFMTNKFLLGSSNVHAYVENSDVFDANFIAAKFADHVELIVTSANFTSEHLSMGTAADKIVSYSTVSEESITEEEFKARFHKCLDLCSAEFFLDLPAENNADRPVEQPSVPDNAVKPKTESTASSSSKLSAVKNEPHSTFNITPAPYFAIGTTKAPAAPPSSSSSTPFIFGASTPQPTTFSFAPPAAPAPVNATPVDTATVVSAVPVATSVLGTPVQYSADHVQALRQRVSAPLSTARSAQTSETCPVCGRSMTVRTNRSTGQQFLGCTGFSSGCRYTKMM